MRENGWTDFSQGGAVGLGNVLRYPSVVFANSGLQWFIPYLIALFFLGIPVLLLELSLGQAYRAGVVTSFNNMNHRAKGTGLGVVLTGYMVVCYYVPILSWVMHYFRCSFHSPFPWNGRGDEFYMQDVIQNPEAIPAVMNGDSIVEYARYEATGMVGETVGWTIFIWFCVWLCMFSGVGVSGRAIYFTMGLPIVMLIVLLGRSASLENAGRGVAYYFAEWHSEKLGSGQIWQAACGQIFFSIGVGFGYFTTYSSYSSRFANTVQDTLIIAFSNSTFEIVAGFIVFSIIGFLDLNPVDDGQSLSTFTVGFLTYPLALSEMSGANFFAVVWFLTIALLGISSSVALIESLITVVNESIIGDRVPRWITATVITIISLLLSLVYCTEFGFWYLDAVDTWVNNITLLLIVWCEIVVVSTTYRHVDVVGQVGKIAWILYSVVYVAAMFVGVVVGQAVGPAAGAGAGFGIFIVGTIISVLLARAPTSIAPRFWGGNTILSKFWWLAFYSVRILRPPDIPKNATANLHRPTRCDVTSTSSSATARTGTFPCSGALSCATSPRPSSPSSPPSPTPTSTPAAAWTPSTLPASPLPTSPSSWLWPVSSCPAPSTSSSSPRVAETASSPSSPRPSCPASLPGLRAPRASRRARSRPPPPERRPNNRNGSLVGRKLYLALRVY